MSVGFYLPGLQRYFARGGILSSSIYILKYLQLKYAVSKLQKNSRKRGTAWDRWQWWRLKFTPASKKWLGWRKTENLRRDRLGWFCDTYFTVILRYSSALRAVLRWHSMEQLFIIHKTQTFSCSFFLNPRNRKCFGQSCVNRPESVHETLRFLFLSHLLYMEYDSCNAISDARVMNGKKLF